MVSYDNLDFPHEEAELIHILFEIFLNGWWGLQDPLCVGDTKDHPYLLILLESISTTIILNSWATKVKRSDQSQFRTIGQFHFLPKESLNQFYAIPSPQSPEEFFFPQRFIRLKSLYNSKAGEIIQHGADKGCFVLMQLLISYLVSFGFSSVCVFLFLLSFLVASHSIRSVFSWKIRRVLLLLRIHTFCFETIPVEWAPLCAFGNCAAGLHSSL